MRPGGDPGRSGARRGYGWRPADPVRQPVLFLNPRSGGGRAARAELQKRADGRGVEVVVLSAEYSLATLVEEAVHRGADALGVAGGDGSLATVASAACVHGLPFICVPAGTRNHFALDVGIDRRELVGALDAFSHAMERRVDIAEVNGRVFLNNVSLGIYADAVRQPAYRDAQLQTLLETAREVLGPSAQTPPLELVDDLGREHSRPAVVLVSNNPYAIGQPLVAGTRPSLSGGLLGIVVVDEPGGNEGTPGRADAPGRAWSAERFEVTAHAPVHAGVDGEAIDLSPPLQFVSRPAALRVRISRRHPGVSPSGRRRPATRRRAAR